MKEEKQDVHWKVQKRAEKIAERWRRALACHSNEVAKAEIMYDLQYINNCIIRKEQTYPELSIKMHRSLYNLLLKMKESVFQKRSSTKKGLMSFRLTERARHRLEWLADKGGVSMTTVVENLIYDCKKFKINIPEQKND